MKLFGFEIARAKSEREEREEKQFNLLTDGWLGHGGWFPIVSEPFTGAWQRNMPLRGETLLAYHAVYACIERIASDIAKCRIRLVEQDANGIWTETSSAAFSPVLRKPNGFQTRIQFFESWVTSKLCHGNTYVLKERDQRQIVTDLYVLDPRGVYPYVAPNGDVYYQLSADNLADLVETNTVPATEIIHDMTSIRYHPLCGVPPLVAAAMPATQGLRISSSSMHFFENRAQPSGTITAPGKIKQDQADRIKEFWSTQFQGGKTGNVAVLGDGLKFEPITFTAVDSQLIEQLGFSAKMVCSAFGVPAHMVGAADPPSYNNIEALNQQYYSQTLQKFFESIEILLDEGLGLTEVPDHTYGTEFDLDDLLRMDTATLIESEGKAVGAAIKTINESRKRLNLGPIVGGNTAYMQQQNYSLAALNKRDSQDNPFAPASPPKPAQPAATSGDGMTPADAAAIKQLAAWQLKDELQRLRAA